MKDLEKAMMRQYQYQILGHSESRNEHELTELQDWAERWIIKKNGKLTISDENEIKRVLDLIRRSRGVLPQ